MKYTYLLMLLLLPALATAATFTDTSDSDFLAGTLSDINVSSNSVMLNTSTGAYVSAGTFTSSVFDLGSNPTATISWNLATPSGTSILVSTRSGSNNTDLSGWSAWSNDYATSGSTITSPMNRYYQYRAQLITTSNASTPVLTDVTITATEQDTNISKASTSANLTGSTSGSYDFRVYVNDTFQILNVTGRYRIDSGAYSAAYPLSLLSGATYNLTIPDQGWSSNEESNLTLEVTASRTNGSLNDSVTSTVTELIDFVNTLPVLDPISNYTISQGAALNITVTGTDTDNHTLTFTTNGSNVTVTSLTNTSARITWTPTATQIGVHTITVSANDSYGASSRNFTVNVTNTNDAPTLSTIAAITGYHGVRQAVILTAYDPDTDANLTFSVTPAFFSIVTSTTAGNSSNVSGYYYGIANFTPADPEDGAHNLTFYVTDGYSTANASTTMTIDYCGDNVCQTTYENVSACAADCDTTEDLQSIALIVPDRNCANQSMRVQAFNATDRFSCYYEGLVQQGLAICSPLSSVTVAVYERNGTLLSSVGSLSTDATGGANFTPPRAGEYKFSASRDGFANASSLVYVRSCDQDIVIKENNVTIEQPPLPPAEEKPQGELPAEETPGELQEEASLLQALIFYVVVPLLLAMLLYAGNVFYEVNKDTLPWLLQLRITLHEKRHQYDPQIQAVKAKTDPFVKPVMQSLDALYTSSLKPLIDRLRKR